MPKPKPPISAAGRLTNPPTTAPTKPRTMYPVIEYTVRTDRGITSAPASAASAPPIAHAERGDHFGEQPRVAHPAEHHQIGARPEQPAERDRDEQRHAHRKVE